MPWLALGSVTRDQFPHVRAMRFKSAPDRRTVTAMQVSAAGNADSTTKRDPSRGRLPWDRAHPNPQSGVTVSGIFDLGGQDGGRGCVSFVAEGGAMPQGSESQVSHSGS